jgi:hypothetical protein
VEVAAELALEHTIDALGFLLLAQLLAVGAEFGAVLAVLAGGVLFLLEGALGRKALGALEEQLLAFAAAEAAFSVGVTGHVWNIPVLMGRVRGQTARKTSGAASPVYGAKPVRESFTLPRDAFIPDVFLLQRILRLRLRRTGSAPSAGALGD